MMKLALVAALSFQLLTLQSYAQHYSRKYDEAANMINWPDQFEPEQSAFYVHNEIEINASPEVVWALLELALEWANWYDGIQNIRFEDPGQFKLELGSKVFWNSMGQSLNNTVIDFSPYRSLAWQFDEKKIQGCHAWVIIPTENGCKVVTDESQNGKLAKLQKMFLPRKLMKQHDKWLRMLKIQAESSLPPQQIQPNIKN